MEPIRPVTTPPAAAVDAPRPVAPLAGIGASAQRQVLDPAVSIDLSPDAAAREAAKPEPDRRGFERDAESQALVFRITDALSGDVIVQIPDEVVLKARAYTRQSAEPVGERIEKRV